MGNLSLCGMPLHGSVALGMFFCFFLNKKIGGGGGGQQIFSFFLHHVTMLVYGSCMQSGLLFIEWCIPLRFLYEEFWCL